MYFWYRQKLINFSEGIWDSTLHYCYYSCVKKKIKASVWMSLLSWQRSKFYHSTNTTPKNVNFINLPNPFHLRSHSNWWCSWQCKVSGDRQREVNTGRKCFLIGGCPDSSQLSYYNYPQHLKEPLKEQENGSCFQGRDGLQATTRPNNGEEPSEKGQEGKQVYPHSHFLGRLWLWQRHARNPRKEGKGPRIVPYQGP